jgi:hypothetical protein
MPVPFNIRLTRESDGAVETCAGTIDDADWALFATFRDYSTSLGSSEWVRACLDAGYSIMEDGAGIPQIEAPYRPSDAAFRELLHLMRPFVLQNEPTWYPSINSTLRGYLQHPYLQDWLAVGRRIFDNGRFHLYGQISINDLPLHSEKTFQTWLNAYEYHRDQTKRAKLEAAFNGPPDEMSLAAFRSILADRTVEVRRLAALISNIENAPSNRQESA